MTVLGAFDSINAKQMPLIVPLCAMAARMRFEKVEEGPKKIRLSFIDADGKQVMPTLETAVQIRIPANSSTATVPIALLIQPLAIPSFGEYSVHLAVDGHEVGSTPLYVRQVQIPPPSQSQTPPATK